MRQLLLLAASLAWTAPALADEPTPQDEASTPTSEKSEEALAKAAQNPLADIYSSPFQDNIGLNYGPNKGVESVLNFQPFPSMPDRSPSSPGPSSRLSPILPLSLDRRVERRA